MLPDVVSDLCSRAGMNDVDASALIGAVNGFVVDSPSTARDPIEALAAAFDFASAERDGVLTFFPRGDEASIDIGVGDFTAASSSAEYAQRADPAEKPIEARVRFLDPARDYLIAEVSARRLDRAQGGVESVDAPLVLDMETADALAQSILADRRAANETLQIELGPPHLALEPGDRITLDGGEDAFEVTRIDDAEARRMELRRTRAPLAAQVSLAVGRPSEPATAPTPAISILDLPPMPGAEDDDRPLAAVFASPWLGDHEIDVGPSVDLATQRATASQPAIMGELVWALWPGPVDRWDEGNVFRVKLYSGSLASVDEDAVLNGANLFAIDAGDSELEIIQARNCVLQDDGSYELSGLLRGQLGSAHAIQSPHPVGARIVAIDARLARIDIRSYEWGEALVFDAPPSGGMPTDARAAQETLTLPHAALRAWAPAHVAAARGASGDVTISWIRCARSGGDAWGASEPPLGAAAEAYLLEIVDGGGAVVRNVTTTSPTYVYLSADQTADFGSLPGSLHIRVAQIGDGGAIGLKTELTITL